MTRCGGLRRGASKKYKWDLGLGGRVDSAPFLKRGNSENRKCVEVAGWWTHLNLLVLASHPSDDVQEACLSPCLRPDLEWRLKLEMVIKALLVPEITEKPRAEP